MVTNNCFSCHKSAEIVALEKKLPIEMTVHEYLQKRCPEALQPVGVTPATTLLEAAELLLTHRQPIFMLAEHEQPSAEWKALGFITSADVLAALCEKKF